MATLAERLRAHLDEAGRRLAGEQEAVGRRLVDARLAWQHQREQTEALRERIVAQSASESTSDARAAPWALLLALAEQERLLARRRADIEGLEYRQWALAEEALRLTQLTAVLAEAPGDSSADEWLRTYDAERARVATWLHDQVAQPLHHLVLQAELAGRWLDADPARAVTELGELPPLATRLLSSVRRLIFELQPMSLGDLGLLPTLERYIQLRAEEEKLITRLQVQGRPRRVPTPLELGAFRIVADALDNVRDHAGTSEALVTLKFADDALAIDVVDHGHGCDLGQVAAARRGTGLANMRARARMLGGQLTLESTPGRGLALHLQLPLAPAAALTPPPRANA